MNEKPSPLFSGIGAGLGMGLWVFLGLLTQAKGAPSWVSMLFFVLAGITFVSGVIAYIRST
jgi:hypothetical protein